MHYLSGIANEETARQLASNPEIRKILYKLEAPSARFTELTEFDLIQSLLKESAAADPTNIPAVWYGELDTSQITKSDLLNTDTDFIVSDRPWIKAAETKSVFVTEPYIDVTASRLLVTIAAPSFAPGSTTDAVGISGVNILLTTVNDRIA